MESLSTLLIDATGAAERGDHSARVRAMNARAVTDDDVYCFVCFNA